MPLVLIVTSSGDAHCDEMEPQLRAAGARIVRLNTDQFVDSRVELSFGDTQDAGTLTIAGERYQLSNITSVWYRRPGIPQTGVVERHQREFAEQELGELLRQLYALTGHARWVSPQPALEAARRKIPQLHRARSCGMRVPKTLASNSPDQIREFFDECSGRMIYKTLHAPIIRPTDGPELWGIPTTVIGKDHIDQIDLIRGTGGIFQEYIEKAYEVRVTIIGEKLFAAKIDSQSDPKGRVDWREAVALGLVSVTPYELPTVVAQQCHAIVAGYGLAFSAIDLIRTPSGEYVFLELNCNGQWLWVEDETEQPLSDAMVQLLTDK